MPGSLLHFGADVACAHQGKATPLQVSRNVFVSGQPLASPLPWGIAGCAFPAPPSGNGPCVTAQWNNFATKVFSNGQAVLLSLCQATCAPTGTPVLVRKSQTKVIGV